MSVDDVTVDLGPLGLFEAKAVRDALGQTIAAGYFADASAYVAVVEVKSWLNYRIAKAEKTATYSEPG